MNDCLPSIQACAMRVARLDSNGVPTPGADNLYVTGGLITLTATPDYRAGDEFEVVTACGDLGVNFKDQDRLKRLTFALSIVAPDPELTEIMAGGTVIGNGLPGGGVGYAAPDLLTRANPNGVSVELWSKRLSPDGAQDATFPWFHWVYPRVYINLGAKDFKNGPMDNPFTGWAIENPNWYDGPVNDWPEPDTSYKVFSYLPMDAGDFPTIECGYQNTPAS